MTSNQYYFCKEESSPLFHSPTLNQYSFVLADLEYFLEEDFDEDKSPDRLLSICFIPSATLTAGFELNLPQNDM
jgi:hypothetical protein